MFAWEEEKAELDRAVEAGGISKWSRGPHPPVQSVTSVIQSITDLGTAAVKGLSRSN